MTTRKVMWKKRFELTIKIMEAITMLQGGQTNAEVAKFYGVSTKTVIQWKRKYKDLQISKIFGTTLDEELFRWHLNCLKEKQYVTNEMIKLKAKELHLKMTGKNTFFPGITWVTKWKKRHGINEKETNFSESSQQLSIPSHPSIEELEDEEEIIKKIDRKLTEFQHKIIYTREECEEDEGDILDEEEYRHDDGISETSSLNSSIYSYDETDEEELEYVRKVDDTISIKTTLEKPSGIEVCDNKEKAGTKISNSDKKPVLEENECSKNVKEEKTGVKNSAVSDLKEFQIIVVNSSSGEESDKENNTDNGNEKDDDDDVVLIENKFEPIVIDSSDEDGGEGEKCYQEGPHQEFKIILLNTKEEHKDFSIVDPGALKTEPSIVVFDK